MIARSESQGRRFPDFPGGMPLHDQRGVPARLRPRFDEIVALTNAFAAGQLDNEYAELCARMAAVLARRRPSLLDRGEVRVWAAAIVHAVGWVNFLNDPSQTPHMSAAELAARIGVGQNTIASHFRKIRAALDLVQMDPEWTRPSQLMDNPLAWTIIVDGFAIDARHAPPEIQEAAFQQGIIPFIPSPELEHSGPGSEPKHGAGTPEPADFADIFAAAEEALGQALAGNPSATGDDLNAALAAAMDSQNRVPQAALGGLSPIDVQRLIDADWTGAASAIQINGSLSLDELGPARALHDARALLALLAEQGEVKATPKGNLPRTFVAAFIERTGVTSGTEVDDTAVERNEENVFALHLSRILLDFAGLVKQRKGIISRTRRGKQLTAAGRAGELFAALVRAQFRELDLAYMDRLELAPALQQTIGYTLYRFGLVGADWRSADELLYELVLAGVRQELPENQYVDVRSLMLETRFLRPLERFGLAESRRPSGEPLARTSYRKTPLFGRFVTCRVGLD